MEITPAFYAHMTSSLMGLAHGKLAVVLEVLFSQKKDEAFLKNINSLFYSISGRLLFEIASGRSRADSENSAGRSLSSC